MFPLSSGLFAYFQLFNFQRAFVLRQLVYTITSYSLCQHLFSTFFNFFKVFCVSALSADDVCYSITSFLLCQLHFLKIFLIYANKQYTYSVLFFYYMLSNVFSLLYSSSIHTVIVFSCNFFSCK